MKEHSVNIHIHKFSFDFECKLEKILKSFGMNNAFSFVDAECIDPNVPYFINYIIQKAQMENDENGTNAAAATAVVSTICGGPYFLNANHP